MGQPATSCSKFVAPCRAPRGQERPDLRVTAHGDRQLPRQSRSRVVTHRQVEFCAFCVVLGCRALQRLTRSWCPAICVHRTDQNLILSLRCPHVDATNPLYSVWSPPCYAQTNLREPGPSVEKSQTHPLDPRETNATKRTRRAARARACAGRLPPRTRAAQSRARHSRRPFALGLGRPSGQ